MADSETNSLPLWQACRLAVWPKTFASRSLQCHRRHGIDLE